MMITITVTSDNMTQTWTTVTTAISWFDCKTFYFRCILSMRLWNAEISLHFNLAFSHCSTSIHFTRPLWETLINFC